MTKMTIYLTSAKAENSNVKTQEVNIYYVLFINILIFFRSATEY